MTSDQIIAFLGFSIVAAITPGPSNVMITATGAAAGFVRGLPCAVGAAIGMGALLFCAALGLGQLVLGWPTLLAVMNGCGAAFLLWLAWKIGTAGTASPSTNSEPVGFMGAALFQWANPKGWLVAVGAAGTHLQGAADQLAQALAFGALFFAAALPSGLVWLLLGAVLQRTLQGERAARLFNRVMGALLAASVIVLLV